jgi:hypothetical protein
MLPSCDFVSFVVVTVKLCDYYVAPVWAISTGSFILKGCQPLAKRTVKPVLKFKEASAKSQELKAKSPL